MSSLFIQILGDDLLAFWPSRINDEYNNLLAECGLPISKGKHLVHHRRMVFARQMYVPILQKYREREQDWDLWVDPARESEPPVSNNKNPFTNGGGRSVIGLRWVPTVSVGAFASGTDEMKTIATAGQMSQWYRTDPLLFKRFRNMLALTNPNIWTSVAKRGVPPCMPLLGLGLPQKRGDPDRLGRVRPKDLGAVIHCAQSLDNRTIMSL